MRSEPEAFTIGESPLSWSNVWKLNPTSATMKTKSVMRMERSLTRMDIAFRTFLHNVKLLCRGKTCARFLCYTFVIITQQNIKFKLKRMRVVSSGALTIKKYKNRAF